MSIVSFESLVATQEPAGPQNEHGYYHSLARQYGTPLMLLDCDQVRHQYRALKEALPGVDLHFALKPLPHPAVVSTLLAEGACFDLATTGEVELVSSQNVPPARTIHTHPIKRPQDIRDALDYGCTTFVFDNRDELEKFIPFADKVELLLRLSFPNKDAYADLSKKFGAKPEDALALLEHAFTLGIRVRGLSFHVGSQTRDPQKYVSAIERSYQVIGEAIEAGLPAMNTLDIGGGFPVSYIEQVTAIDEFCAPIRAALGKLPDTLKLIAEPGRFIVAGAVTSLMSVMGQAERGGKRWYYMDDGVYGSFSGLMFGESPYPLQPLVEAGESMPSVLAGPTCDSIDVIDDNIMLPKLSNGDLILARQMGAYTIATATEFNFFRKAQIVVLDSHSIGPELVAN